MTRSPMTSTSPLPLPQLTEADPPVAGEGSLDPLGLAGTADRLADYLLPGIRARMRRIRFLTASAVGALAADDLFDIPPVDGASTPSICFEWLVLEAFGRKHADGAPLDSAGVPGSSKVRAVLAQGKRLTVRNYLRAPSVFGFTGVYLPLARHLQVLDEDRRPASSITHLTRAWEQDRGLDGFTDSTPGTDGRSLRRRINDEVRASLHSGQCAANERAGIWKQLTDHLHPLRPGPRERGLIRSWLTADSEPVQAELARFLDERDQLGETDLVQELLASNLSAATRVRLDAIVAFERAAMLLDAAFRQLRWASTYEGTAPISAVAMAKDPVIATITADLARAVLTASERIANLDPDIANGFGQRFGAFQFAMAPADLVDTLMVHHEAIQSAKLPKGKRPWFDRLGGGWIVRSLYRNNDAVDLDELAFIHPYRLAPLGAFMKDLAE